MEHQSQETGLNVTKNKEQIITWLVNQVAGILYVDPKTINVNASFNSFGLSSRDAVMLSGDLEEWLDIRLSPTLVYEYPTISALAEYLTNMEANQDQAVLSTPLNKELEPISAPEPSTISNIERIQAVEQLDDEEAEMLLLEKLNQLNLDLLGLTQLDRE